jgi:hypothetical protein
MTNDLDVNVALAVVTTLRKSGEKKVGILTGGIEVAYGRGRNRIVVNSGNVSMTVTKDTEISCSSRCLEQVEGGGIRVSFSEPFDGAVAKLPNPRAKFADVSVVRLF